MTDRKSLGTLVTELVEFLNKGSARSVLTKIQEIEKAFQSYDKYGGMHDEMIVIQAERHFGNFKWLLGVNQRDRAMNSLLEARTLLVGSARDWLNKGGS